MLESGLQIIMIGADMLKNLRCCFVCFKIFKLTFYESSADPWDTESILLGFLLSMV